MSVINELLARAVELGASDVHLKPDQQPYLRLGGRLQPAGYAALSADDLIAIIDDLLPNHVKDEFKHEHEADFSHKEEDVGRFRVNVFQGEGMPAVAMRHVKDQIPTLEELRLPTALYRLAEVQRGIVLLCGSTGSGKSTTLAAIIGEINRRFERRIITIEDPIEYEFNDQLCLITQREIGLDTLCFANALKHVLRQDPDVILIGEMRDPETIRTALLASETGHLVLSTLHASTAALAIPRMLDVFPPDEHEQIRFAMAANMQAVICQRLIPDSSGGVIPASEICFNTPTVQKLIRANRLDIISAAIETGKEDGMQTFNQSLYSMIKDGTVSETEGMRHATNPESLRMNLQGIFLDESRKILSTLI